MKRYIPFIIFLIHSIIAFGQSSAVLFDRANKFYNEGNYQGAVANYLEILNNGEHSAELYYNLANSYYKLNEVGPSIYYYEKALLLSPEDTDIINNLSFAQNMTVDAIEVVPEFGATRAVRDLSDGLKTDQWAIFSTCLTFLLCFCLAFYLLYEKTILKRLFFIGSFICVLLVSGTLFFAFHSAETSAVKHGIIFAKESKIMSDPNLSSGTAFMLHEGTKVTVVERYNSYWVKVKLADGKTGWALLEDLKLL